MFDFFENALECGATLQPHQAYKELQQAFVNEQWDNTVAMQLIEEQDRINEGWNVFTFHPIEVWIDYVVGESSRGSKTSEDFASLIFRNLDYQMYRGRYYKFDNNFWLAYFENKFNGVVKSMAVRRCNNFMRIVDPQNGGVYTIPCVIDYDMASPSNQVGKDIITPNNHAVVMVQGNDYTNRLFKTNTRYIFNGRPFKLQGFQNTLNNNYFENQTTLLYLDLYLDEIHAEDDLENQIADNGQYQYSISIDNKESLADGVLENTSGQLYSSVLLNGVEQEARTIWTSSNPLVAIVDDNGMYEIIGSVGESCIITATLEGNSAVNDIIELNVVELDEMLPAIVIEPSFEIIRECETINFNVEAIYNGQTYKEIETQVSLDETEEILVNENLTIEKNGNEYVLNCIRRSNEPQYLYVNVSNAEPEFSGNKQFKINLVSLMG